MAYRQGTPPKWSLIIVLMIFGATLYVAKHPEEYGNVFIHKNAPTKIEDQQPAPIAEQIEEETQEPQDWTQYVAPQGDFMVDMPKMPMHTFEVIDDVLSEMHYCEDPINSNILAVNTLQFTSSFSDTEHKSVLDWFVDDVFAANHPSTIQKRIYGDFQGCPSVDVDMEGEDFQIMVKAFIYGDTLFVLTSKGSLEKFNPESFDKFVNTFILSQDSVEDNRV